jgi:hypothetical protein
MQTALDIQACKPRSSYWTIYPRRRTSLAAGATLAAVAREVRGELQTRKIRAKRIAADEPRADLAKNAQPVTIATAEEGTPCTQNC